MCKVKAKEKRQKMEENKMTKITRTVGVVRERERERATDQKKLLKFVIQKM